MMNNQNRMNQIASNGAMMKSKVEDMLIDNHISLEGQALWSGSDKTRGLGRTTIKNNKQISLIWNSHEGNQIEKQDV